MRKSCKECVIKHMGQAIVLIGEVDRNHPEHMIIAIGHLAEAEEEVIATSPEIAEELRNLRRNYFVYGDDPTQELLRLYERVMELQTWCEIC